MRKCSFCSTSGHNSRTCPTQKKQFIEASSISLALVALYKKWLSLKRLMPGSLVKVERRKYVTFDTIYYITYKILGAINYEKTLEISCFGEYEHLPIYVDKLCCLMDSWTAFDNNYNPIEYSLLSSEEIKSIESILECQNISNITKYGYDFTDILEVVSAGTAEWNFKVELDFKNVQNKARQTNGNYDKKLDKDSWMFYNDMLGRKRKSLEALCFNT